MTDRPDTAQGAPGDDEAAPLGSLGPPPADAPGRVVVEERMHPLSPLVSLWIGVVAFGWFALTSILQGDRTFADMSDLVGRIPWWLLFLMGALLLGLAWGYWSWWTTKFIIDDAELRIENTGAFQESKRIAFSRIQSIDITQPFAARLLGLAELSIDVGADTSTKLAYLKRGRAAEIRDYLMVRAHGRSASTKDAATPDAAASAWDDLSARDEILIRLSPGEVILGAVASLEVIGLLIAFGIPMAIAAALDVPALAVGTGIIPLAIALAGFLSNRLFGQFNYTLAQTSAGVRITRGLFTLKSQTVPAHRVQAIRISQPLPWRWLNRARLDVTVLGLGLGGDGEGPATTMLLPIGRPHQVQAALAALWPGLELDRLTFNGPPRRARWLDPFAFPWLGYALDDQVVVSRLGWLNRTQQIVPHARMQSVRLTQGPLERRVGVATVQLHTTNPLGERIVHIDADEARGLVFRQMDRARSSRTDELLDPPGLRETLVHRADAPADANVWLLRTHTDAAAEQQPAPVAGSDRSFDTGGAGLADASPEAR